MRWYGRGMEVAVLLLFGGLVATPAVAFDCAQAKQPIEKMICADPAAKASDDAMDAAFAGIRAALPEDQKKPALDDQRRWLKERNRNCLNEKVPAACIASANNARVGVLTARPESGPGLSRRPLPYFVNQTGSRDKVEVSVQLYSFPDPATPGERLLDAEAKKTAEGIAFKKDEPDERDWSHEESWAIAYASPTFLSIWSTGYDFSGGAHGSASGRGIHIDLRKGKLLGFADLFDAKAQAAIDKICLAKVKAEKVERGAGEDIQPDLPKQVADVVKDLANWSFKEKTARIEFGQYAVGAYAEGVYECEIPIDQVNTLAKEPLPLR